MFDTKTARNWSKAGMVISLGGLVWTGMGRGCVNRQWHTWAGIALVGFSVWHYNVYNPPSLKALEHTRKS